jgi:uncharacterized coiled-coil DUF342 family protein
MEQQTAPQQFDLRRTLTELQYVAEENKKLQSLKERYIEFSKQLSEIGKSILSIAKEIDPVSGISHRNGAKRSNESMKEIADAILQRMMAGTQFKRQDIKTLYAEDDDSFLGAIIRRLMRIPNVTKVRDAKGLRYYWKG